MAKNVAPGIPRAEASPPNTDNNSPRRPSRRNFRNAGPGNRAIRDFAGETKEVEAVLTLVTEQVDKGVTFEIFQDRLRNYVLKKPRKRRRCDSCNHEA